MSPSFSRRPRWPLLLLAAVMTGMAGDPSPAPAQGDAALAPPDKVAAAIVELLDAPLVGVDALLRATPQQHPAFRLRLYVAAQLSGQAWVGVDYHAHRAGGRPQRIELAMPAAALRDRVQTLLEDPGAVLNGPGEAGVRVVDVWCRHAGGASGHAVQIVKVWHDVPEAGLSAERAESNPTGRVCHDDLPVLTECQQVFDFTTLLEGTDLRGVGVSDELLADVTRVIGVHRAERDALRATPQPAATVQTTTVPGGATIEVLGAHDFPTDVCDQKGTAVRTLPTGETFLGLANESRTGTVRFALKLPFAAGGIAVWAPTRITDATVTLELEASMDGRRWTRLARLDATAMSDERTHVLPPSVLGKSTLFVRARLTAREDTPPAACATGLRFLEASPPVQGRYWLAYADESLSVRERPEPVMPDQVRLSVRAQPETLSAADVAAIIEAGGDEIDIFPPCELDARACQRIAAHPGVVRFWSPSAWQQGAPPDWLTAMGAGEGCIVFAGVSPPAIEFVKALAGGRKSLGFPGITSPSGELLAALAECRAELGLDGMEALSPEQSLALARYAGPRLSLAGLRTARLGPDASPALLRAAVAASGTCSLPGLARLDAATAAGLAAGRKDLVLDDVVELPPESARMLASSSRGLTLDGLPKLDAAATAAVLQYAGPSLSLASLRQVECAVDDLLPAETGRDRSLRALVAPVPTPAEAAAAVMKVCLAEADALFSAAVARGAEDASGREAVLQEVRDSADPVAAVNTLRSRHPQVPPASTVWIGGTTGTPLDAVVRAPGVLTVRRREGVPAGRGRLTKTVAQTLARGGKQLDLDGLADLDVEAAAALAGATTVVSLDGLRSMTLELATALQPYKGPLLSLQGVEMIDDPVAAVFETAVKEDRACLTAVDMINIDGLRTFVADTQQQKKFESFWSLSKSREWSGVARAAKGRGRVTVLLRNEVLFENDGREARMIRDVLSGTSRKQLLTLTKNAAEVAAGRKARLLAVAAGTEPAFATPAADK